MKQPKPLRIPDFVVRKQAGEKITMLAVYDATMARLLDRAGLDAVLVGDSLGMVVMGQENTLGVTMDVMVHHTKAVRAGTRRATVIADLPFLSYQTSVEDAMRNAGRLLQEGGAQAVKLEGGRSIAPTIARLVDAGIPVMGHIGLMPQSVHQLGGFRAVGNSDAEMERVLDDARALEQAGAFAVVLEGMPSAVAQRVTQTLAIPTIGIGAGPHCDGQILVSYDALGLFDEFVPSFVKRYANLAEIIEQATRAYIDDVRQGKFPA